MKKELRKVMDVFEEDIDDDECMLFYIDVFNYYRKKFLPEYYQDKENK